MRLNDFTDWYALDAVAVSGFAAGPANVLKDPSRLYFKPAEHFNGVVSGVAVSANDCKFYRDKRMASEAARRGVLDLSVVAVHDAPVAGDIEIEARSEDLLPVR